MKEGLLTVTEGMKGFPCFNHIAVFEMKQDVY